MGIHSLEWEFVPITELDFAKKVVEAMESNRDEWLFEQTLESLSALALKEGVYCVPDRHNPVAMAFFSVESFPSGNSQLNVLWSWGSVEKEHVAALVEAAELHAKTHGASRIWVLSCRKLFRALHEFGFTAKYISCVKEV